MLKKFTSEFWQFLYVILVTCQVCIEHAWKMLAGNLVQPLCQARYWKSLPESSTWKYLQVIQDKYETDGSENDVQDDSPFLLCYLNEDYSCFILNSLVVLMFNGNDGVLEQKILLPDNASFCSIIGLLIFTSQSLIYSSHKWEGISYM